MKYSLCMDASKCFTHPGSLNPSNHRFPLMNNIAQTRRRKLPGATLTQVTWPASPWPPEQTARPPARNSVSPSPTPGGSLRERSPPAHMHLTSAHVLTQNKSWWVTCPRKAPFPQGVRSSCALFSRIADAPLPESVCVWVCVCQRRKGQGALTFTGNCLTLIPFPCPCPPTDAESRPCPQCPAHRRGSMCT